MQDALLALTKYWTDRGCMIVQPFNTEVGAGTLNPATILRVLGPEPWRVAYVEPSVRPDDARYGENPNRLQTHTQFQVILKPDPGDPQEQYLASLEALGIDIHAHDIRFVEDNWANPATGSWGLGWEVWLDGLEITQFTYFQQAGGMSLDPVSVEITYGVERIIMALQNVSHFKDIAYAPGISYGEAFGQAEYEMSRFYLDDADVETQKRLFEDYADEARRMLDARLPVPAHLHVLKCSHTFNVLDSRGAVSTTERAKAFARMRGLAREVSALWAERRDGAGPPARHRRNCRRRPRRADVVRRRSTAPAPLLFEIGTEELPPHEVTRSAARGPRRGDQRSSPAPACPTATSTVHATPRRIVVLVDDVAPAEPDAERFVRGPRASAAFDADGAPTKAAAGFARGQKIDPAALERVDVDGVEYVGVTKTDHGRGARRGAERRARRGGRGAARRQEHAVERPEAVVHAGRSAGWWRCWATEVVPVAASSLTAGRTTRVHRTAATAGGRGADGGGLPGLPRRARHRGVGDGPPRRDRRRRRGTLAASVGGTIDVDGESALIDEITNLVEEPNAILGGFSETYLELPQEILTTVMRKHQRYLPVRTAGRRAAAALRGGGQRRLRPRRRPRGQRGGAAREVRGRELLLARGPEGGPGDHEGGPRPAGLRGEAGLDGRPRGPDRRGGDEIWAPNCPQRTVRRWNAPPHWRSSTWPRRWSSS